MLTRLVCLSLSLAFNTRTSGYIWDTITDSILPATNLTTPFVGTPKILNANFSTFWYDANTLLAGSTNVRTLTSRGQTQLFHPAQSTRTTLSTRSSEGWALSQNDLLAYRIFDTLNYINVNFNIEIATLTNASLNVLTTLPAGCNLSWSPDGELLAYTTHGTPFTNCRHPEQGITIYNRITGQSSQIDISGYTGIIPVGWVVAPPEPIP